MLKLCDEAICRPLNIIFKICLHICHFCLEWKKGNFVPIHNKYDKRNVKNYRPVSLFSMCGKISVCLIFIVMYDFLSDNNLLFSPTQSGFRADDFCVSQLLSINHKILNTFDKGLEVCCILLDISKAFDKV